MAGINSPMSHEDNSKDSGISRRNFLISWSAVAVAGVLASSNLVEAQERPRTNFRTFQEARQYAESNGFVMVNTSRNGTVFISQEAFQSIESASWFSIRQSATGINYIISTSPNTVARVQDEFIIGWRWARIDIQEARQGGRDNDGGWEADTWTDTGTDTGWDTGGENPGNGWNTGWNTGTDTGWNNWGNNGWNNWGNNGWNTGWNTGWNNWGNNWANGDCSGGAGCA